MPSILIDVDDAIRLKDIKHLILKMKWEDLEELARSIEDVRSKGAKSQRKVTGKVVLDALTQPNNNHPKEE